MNGVPPVSSFFIPIFNYPSIHFSNPSIHSSVYVFIFTNLSLQACLTLKRRRGYNNLQNPLYFFVHYHCPPSTHTPIHHSFTPHSPPILPNSPARTSGVKSQAFFLCFVHICATIIENMPQSLNGNNKLIV